MSVLGQNQQVKDEEEVYFNFINSIKSEVTKKVYEDGIRLYLKFCNLSKLRIIDDCRPAEANNWIYYGIEK